MKNRIFWVAASVGVILDRITKIWILNTFVLQQSMPIIPGILHFTYVVNRGAAFSLFSGAAWLPWLSLVVSVGLGLMAVMGPKFPRWEQLGYGFILSGAFGNGIDRFAFGHVIDFVDVRAINFAVFNVADVLINVGIVCLLIATFRRSN
jgi:signal peptidase II